MRYRAIQTLLLSLLLFFGAAAQAFAVQAPPQARAEGAIDDGQARAHTTLVFDRESVAPGSKFRVGVLFELEDHWHVYGRDPGDSGLPTDIVWSGEGLAFGPLQWPPTRTFVEASGAITTYGYEKWVLLWSEATAPPNASGELEVGAELSYLACKIKCLPGNASLSRALPVGENVPVTGELATYFEQGTIPPEASQEPTEPEPAAAATGVESAKPTEAPLPLWQVLWLAFLGGILLNLMPCVFPVLALKVFGFVSTGREGRAVAMRHAAAYAGGIGVSMAILAGAVIAIQAGGDAVGWGFQFQEPAYVAALTLVVTLFALNLFGVFDVPMMPVPSSSHTGKLGEPPPVARSFVDGVFAVVLATPCSAPFLGTAVGFALASDAVTIFASFMMVGAGLAAPYVVASSWPALARRLPQPGPWMETFERILGFLLLGTSVWLVWVYGRVAGPDAVAALLATAVVGAFGVWVWGRVQYGGKRGRVLGGLTALALLLGALALFRPHDVEPVVAASIEDTHWVAFDEQEIAAAQARGQVVFVDFTADWCITCKVNERTVLAKDRVMAALTADGVVMMKADWTRRDERIRKVLARFGRAGVPMYLVYPAGGGEPEVLSEVLSPSLVIDALQRGRKPE